MASAGKPEPEPQRAAWSLVQWAAVGIATVGGFFAGAGLCLAACYGVLYLYASGLPQRAEVSDALADVPVILGGAALSLALSLIAGVASALWTSARVSRLWASKEAEPSAAPDTAM